MRTFCPSKWLGFQTGISSKRPTKNIDLNHTSIPVIKISIFPSFSSVVLRTPIAIPVHAIANAATAMEPSPPKVNSDPVLPL